MVHFAVRGHEVLAARASLILPTAINSVLYPNREAGHEPRKHKGT